MNKAQFHKRLKKLIPQKNIAERFFKYVYHRSTGASDAQLLGIATDTYYLRDFANLYERMETVMIFRHERKNRHVAVEWYEEATTYLTSFYFDQSLVDRLYKF